MHISHDGLADGDVAFRGLGPLEPRSLADQAADAVVQAIAAGVIVPGQRIFEQKLCSALGVSRIPVREGLRILEAQGLLITTRHRGSRVVAFDDNRMRELFDVRIALERVAIRDAVATYRRDRRALDGLESIVAQMAKLAETGDRLAMNQADMAFHRELILISNNGILGKLWEAISRHVLIVFGLEISRNVDLAAVHEQHVRLARMLAEGNITQLEREIERHIRRVPRQAGNERAAREGGRAK